MIVWRNSTGPMTGISLRSGIGDAVEARRAVQQRLVGLQSTCE